MPTSRIFILFPLFLILALLLIPHNLIYTSQLPQVYNYHQMNSFQADPTPTSLTTTPTSGQTSYKFGGGNTVLICGAGILLMIILGAVLFVPRPPNHADK